MPSELAVEIAGAIMKIPGIASTWQAEAKAAALIAEKLEPLRKTGSAMLEYGHAGHNYQTTAACKACMAIKAHAAELRKLEGK